MELGSAPEADNAIATTLRKVIADEPNQQVKHVLGAISEIIEEYMKPKLRTAIFGAQCEIHPVGFNSVECVILNQTVRLFSKRQL